MDGLMETTGYWTMKVEALDRTLVANWLRKRLWTSRKTGYGTNEVTSPRRELYPQQLPHSAVTADLFCIPRARSSSTYSREFKVLLKWLTERAYPKILTPKGNSEHRELLWQLRTSNSHSYSFCICLRPFTGQRSALWGASKGHDKPLTLVDGLLRETRVRSQICAPSDIWTSTSVVSCRCNSTSAGYPLIHLSPTRCNHRPVEQEHKHTVCICARSWVPQ